MSDAFGYGQMTPTDTATDFGAISFLIKQQINKISTVMPVQVMSVTTSGGLAPVGFVDVQPLVSLLDGNGNASSHGVVHGVPYFRLQGGTNAVIIDPVVGDVGYITCASHDISSVKNKKGAATPGSRRRFSLADGIYIGGILNGTPQQYVQINSSGVTVADNNNNTIMLNAQGITLTSLNVTITGNLQLGGAILGTNGGTYPGNIRVGGNIVAGFGTGTSVGLSTHTHTQGVDSHGDTEAVISAPTPGT